MLQLADEVDRLAEVVGKRSAEPVEDEPAGEDSDLARLIMAARRMQGMQGMPNMGAMHGLNRLGGLRGAGGMGGKRNQLLDLLYDWGGGGGG